MAAHCLLLALTAAAQVPFFLEGPGVDPADFEVTVFASGLDFPNGMAELPDGSLIVTVDEGTDGYFDGQGKLIRLVDTDNDGVADGIPDELYSGLPPSLTAVCTADSLVFAMGAGTSIFIFRAGAPADPLTLIGEVEFTYPITENNYHRNSALELRRSPGEPNRYDLFFQIGSQQNFETSTEIVTLSSVSVLNVSGLLPRDSAYMMTLEDQGTQLEMIDVTQIATGLRNASGFSVQQATGDLYFNDNGIDGLVDSNEPHSADELNTIAREDIGTSVFNFGYPSTYTAYRTGTLVGSGGIQPLIAFQPVGDPETGLRSEGPNGVAFAPPAFPDGLNTGVFLGFHGKFFFGGLANDENPVVYANPDTGSYFHFIRGQQEGIGHLIGLLSTRTTLYIADISSSGDLGEVGAGVIYKIRSLAPEDPVVNMSRQNDTMRITWDRGQLYRSTTLSDDWSLQADEFSPFEFQPSSSPEFYRVEY